MQKFGTSASQVYYNPAQCEDKTTTHFRLKKKIYTYTWYSKNLTFGIEIVIYCIFFPQSIYLVRNPKNIVKIYVNHGSKFRQHAGILVIPSRFWH